MPEKRIGIRQQAFWDERILPVCPFMAPERCLSDAGGI
jgi:hypothetical protein